VSTLSKKLKKKKISSNSGPAKGCFVSKSHFAKNQWRFWQKGHNVSSAVNKF